MIAKLLALLRTIAALALAGLALPALAITQYATTITSSTGSFAGNPSAALFAPDSSIVQFGSGSVLVLDFGVLSSAPTQLRIVTIDDILPATARIEVTADLLSYQLVAASMTDANGVRVGNVYPGVTFSVASAYRYVRISDLGTSPPPYQNEGFDLDAVVRAAVPEPSALSFWLGGFPIVIGAGLRRLQRSSGRQAEAFQGASGATSAP